MFVDSPQSKPALHNTGIAIVTPQKFNNAKNSVMTIHKFGTQKTIQKARFSHNPCNTIVHTHNTFNAIINPPVTWQTYTTMQKSNSH